MISIQNETINIEFSKWDPAAYDLFLKSKKLPEYNLRYDWRKDAYHLTAPSRFAPIFGLKDTATDRGWLPFSEHLFDYQEFISRTALKAKRYAVWADTGLGKTHIQCEFVRQVQHRTNGRVLMVVPLNIIPQTMEVSENYFGIRADQIETREDMKKWCKSGSGIAITNPEKFIPSDGRETVSECQYLNGVILDEASILKSGGGKIKWALIKSCRGIEYKLSLTATPAPNEVMEYASQGSFLEKLRNEGEILWTFFTRDKAGNWKVKDHAVDAFYRFMAGWSVYLRNPASYGFADNLKDLPDPVIKEYRLNPTQEQMNMIRAVPDATGQLGLFGKTDQKLAMVERSKYSQIAKGFIYDGNRGPRRIPSPKPAFVADLIKNEVRAGLQVLVWTVFDEESEIIAELLNGSGIEYQVLSGGVPKPRRPGIIESFRKNRTPVLISKASLLGFGLNFQNCGSMIFSGFNDSFEQFYQAVRRAYRYGQTRPVRIHIPYIPELEGVMWENVKRKQEQFIADTTRQERNYLQAMKGLIDGFRG